MATLTLGAQPGFTEIADSTFDAGNAVSAATMKALNADAKFATVRQEIFEGYYHHGDTVILPTSAADGYTYARAELNYMWSIYATAPPSSITAGQTTPPSLTTRGAAGQLLEIQGWVVDPTTGVVSLNTHYYVTNGAEGTTTDGVIKVTVIATRLK